MIDNSIHTFKSHWFAYVRYFFSIIIPLIILLVITPTISPYAPIGVIILFLWIFYCISSRRVTVNESNITTTRLNIWYRQTKVIPFEKVNDINFSNYYFWIWVITIKTWNDKETKLMYYKEIDKLYEMICEATK